MSSDHLTNSDDALATLGIFWRHGDMAHGSVRWDRGSWGRVTSLMSTEAEAAAVSHFAISSCDPMIAHRTTVLWNLQ
eukprot:m.191437 g.191437  ORF g.191437 m.191437 type:complete len:77 (+) comp24921_c0_seq2:103-333(+)